MEEKEYETVTTVTEANKNFLDVAMLAEKNGKVTILKDGNQSFYWSILIHILNLPMMKKSIWQLNEL